MILGSQRHLFEIPEDVVYLNCAYMSPLSRSVREAGEAAVARKSRPWTIHTEDFFRDSETARGLFADLIGADAGAVAIVPSASYGIAVAAINLHPSPGQTILVLADQFPSNVYAWLDLAARSGATVVTVARPADHDWTGALLAQIDARTAIVAVPNCHWTDGSLVDLVRIGAAARQAGADLVVDATQSLGAYPFDVAAVQPDFLICATYKWLLGPYSLGFLYVAPRFQEGRPLEYNWITRTGSEDFNRLVDYRDDFQPGARRFDVGERSNFALMPMAVAALRQVLAWRVPAIHESLQGLTGTIERRARDLGLDVVPAERRGGHMIGLRLREGAGNDLRERLAAANVHVSLRGGSLRVSPHLYNDEGDLDRLFAVLATAL